MLSKCSNCKREYALGELKFINCVCGAKVYNQENCLEFKPASTNEIEEYVKRFKLHKGDIVIDAGAYIGQFTILASGLVGDTGKVISFEPNPNNYNELVKNTRGLRNVMLINNGLWSEDKNLQLRMNGMASTFLSCYDINWPIVNVPVVSLDNELKKLKIDKVNFIKMDIEGSEIEAIKGCKEILKNDVKLVIASYHTINGEMTHTKIEKQLREYGYQAETKREEQILTYGWR